MSSPFKRFTYLSDANLDSIQMSPGEELLREAQRSKYFTFVDRKGRVNRLIGSYLQNKYVLHSNSFTSIDYPKTWPLGNAWPPQTIEELIVPTLGNSSEDVICVGNHCYNYLWPCRDLHCSHNFAHFQNSSENWRYFFELRETKAKGIGVFAKRPFGNGKILGWYAGEIRAHASDGSMYAIDMAIGNSANLKQNKMLYDAWQKCEEEAEDGDPHTRLNLSPDGQQLDEVIAIDARNFGNWTRFINHSCDASTEFNRRRVGGMLIMTVESKVAIPMGAELTVDYGDEYFKQFIKDCQCGSHDCRKYQPLSDESESEKDSEGEFEDAVQEMVQEEYEAQSEYEEGSEKDDSSEQGSLFGHDDQSDDNLDLINWRRNENVRPNIRATPESQAPARVKARIQEQKQRRHQQQKRNRERECQEARERELKQARRREAELRLHQDCRREREREQRCSRGREEAETARVRELERQRNHKRLREEEEAFHRKLLPPQFYPPWTSYRSF